MTDKCPWENERIITQNLSEPNNNRNDKSVDWKETPAPKIRSKIFFILDEQKNEIIAKECN